MGFFGEAGIPSAAAKTYAASFVENRIRGDMLADLDKEYLRDMGITVLGDIICILKYAKKVVETRKKEISLKDNATASTGGAAQVKNSDSGEAVSGADIVRFEKRGGGLDDKSGVAKVSIIYICCLCILPSRIGLPPTVTLNTVDRDRSHFLSEWYACPLSQPLYAESSL